MSELLAAAAAALGTPEALVKRAAEARAAATGASVDEVLAAWGGGADVPAPSAPPATPDPDEAEPAAALETPAPPAPPPPSPAVPAGGPPTGGGTYIGPYKPPVLVGASDNPVKVLAGVVGLFLVVLLVALIGPAMPTEIPGARTSDIAFSDQAASGQHIYLKLGCASCHTQMVRPVVADVGLGPVSLNDTNLVLGIRRFGPDLANIGERSDDAYIEGMIRGAFDHPSHNLSSTNMSALIAYLAESSTTGDR